jgi:hypothetical protein
MASGPAAVSAFAGTSAVTRRLLTNIVGKLLAFHCTVEPGMKFVPTTLRVKLGPACSLLFGDTAAMLGVGFSGGVPVTGSPPPQEVSRHKVHMAVRSNGNIFMRRSQTPNSNAATQLIDLCSREDAGTGCSSHEHFTAG